MNASSGEDSRQRTSRLLKVRVREYLDKSCRERMERRSWTQVSWQPESQLKVIRGPDLEGMIRVLVTKSYSEQLIYSQDI